MRLFTYLLALRTLMLGHISCSSFQGHANYKGCFSVLGLHPQLGHILHPFLADDCLNRCSGNGYRYAGIESVTFVCYCAHDILDQITKADNSLCKPCEDGSNLFCGGDLKLSLYEIGANMVTGSSMGEHHEIDKRFEEEPLILLAGEGGVYLYNISSHDLKTVISTDNPVDAIDYDLRKQEGFGILDRNIYRFPLFEEYHPIQGQDLTFVESVMSCSTFAVDWIHGMIFISYCFDHKLIIQWSKIYTEFGDKKVIINQHEGVWIMDMVVDPHKSLLFWTTGTALWSCDFDGLDLKKVVPEFPVNSVASLSVDLAAARVYFSGVDKQDEDSSLLYYTSYNGSISHSLQFHEYEGGIHSLSFGIFNHHVYFLKDIDSNSSVLMASKLEYNHRPSVILQGKHVQDLQLNRLKLVHPRLQPPSAKVDACTNRGCSHLCKMEASQPRCYCPPHYDLDHDNKTCTYHHEPGVETDEEPLKITAIDPSTLDHHEPGVETDEEPLKITAIDPSTSDHHNGVGYGEEPHNVTAIDPSTLAHMETTVESDETPIILLAGHGGIYMFTIDNQTLRTVVDLDSPVDAIDYNIHKEEGFAIWDKGIYRFPLFGEHPLNEHQTTHFASVNEFPSFTVDWVHDKLYYPDWYGHNIIVLDLNSEYYKEEIIITPPEGACAKDIAVDPYKGLLFWTTGATLWSCRLDGRELKKVVPEFPVNRVTSLSMDLAAARVYFSGVDKQDQDSSLLYYTSYNGSISNSLQFHEYVEGRYISSFGIFNHHVYFIIDNRGNSVLVVAKLEYNHRPYVNLDDKDVQVNLLKLVHHRLQSPAKVDACTDRGCSHVCVMEALQPHCYCPGYYVLDHDNKTCTLDPGEEPETPLLLQIASGLMLVLIVLLGAGVLMCLCDKIWSQLHPTVVRLNLPGAARRSFTGQRRHDGENLI